MWPSSVQWASPWPGGKWVRFCADRSRFRHSAGSYQDLVNWYCSLLTRRMVCVRAAGAVVQNAKTQPNQMILDLEQSCHKTIVDIKHHQNTIWNHKQIIVCRVGVKAMQPMQLHWAPGFKGARGVVVGQVVYFCKTSCPRQLHTDL